MSAARQRLLGLLVLAVVAVAAVVVAQLLHAPVTGNAQRGPIPGPPAVGDCLLAAPTVVGPHEAQDGTTLPTHPWLRTGPCQGRRFGEVAAVLTEKDLPQQSSASAAQPNPNAGGGHVGDPYSDVCRPAVLGWLGLPTPDGLPARGQWAPDLLAVGLIMSGPNQIQRTAGQNWVACIAGSQQWGTLDTGYDSTARNTFDPGPALPVFAYCMATVDNGAPVPCTQAHTTERFGSTLSAHAGVTDQDRRDCENLTRRLTGMPDPTAGGKLTPTVAVNSILRSDLDGLSVQECFLVTAGKHQLTGPLLGLATRPIPVT